MIRSPHLIGLLLGASSKQKILAYNVEVVAFARVSSKFNCPAHARAAVRIQGQVATIPAKLFLYFYTIGICM
jgi:hypothetical protein